MRQSASILRDARAYGNRAIVWLEKGDNDKSIADCDIAMRLGATRLGPEMAKVYGNRGWAWMAKKDYDKAMADLNEAIRLDATLAFAYCGRGDLWFRKGDLDKAIADCNQAIKRDAESARAYPVRAFSVAGTRMNMINASRILTRRSGKAFVIRVHTYVAVLRGRKRRSLTRPSRIIPRRFASIPRMPSRSTAELAPGSSRENIAKKAADYAEAVRLDPRLLAGSLPTDGKGDMSRAWIGRMVVPRHRVFTLKATDGKGTLAGVPDQYQVQRVDGTSLLIHGRGLAGWVRMEDVFPVDRAIELYNEAIRIDPRDTFSRVMRASFLLAKKQVDQAFLEFDEAIRLDPKNAFAFCSRANAWAKKNEYDKAATDYEQAIRLDPHDAANLLLARIHSDA